MPSGQTLEHVSFDKPDEVREGGNWRMELVNLAGGAQVGRITIQPGWNWSRARQAGGGYRPVHGSAPAVSAQRTNPRRDGRRHPGGCGPGEIMSLPPGHDAWVVGDEPVVAIDWQGASVWAREEG